MSLDSSMMQIIYLDKDPRFCAQSFSDRHVKLYHVYLVHILNNVHPDVLHVYNSFESAGKASIWARESLENYQWLLRLATLVNVEHIKRFGKPAESQTDLKKIALLGTSHLTFSSKKFIPPPILLNADEIHTPPEGSSICPVVYAYRAWYHRHCPDVRYDSVRPAPPWFRQKPVDKLTVAGEQPELF